jgi:hypothetical protein
VIALVIFVAVEGAAYALIKFRDAGAVAAQIRGNTRLEAGRSRRRDPRRPRR